MGKDHKGEELTRNQRFDLQRKGVEFARVEEESLELKKIEATAIPGAQKKNCKAPREIVPPSTDSTEIEQPFTRIATGCRPPFRPPPARTCRGMFTRHLRGPPADRSQTRGCLVATGCPIRSITNRPADESHSKQSERQVGRRRVDDGSARERTGAAYGGDVGH